MGKGVWSDVKAACSVGEKSKRAVRLPGFHESRKLKLQSKKRKKTLAIY